MRSDQELFDELTFYTLAHGDPAFIHQNVVDAFAAQHADESSKPIYVVFALVGLYLCVEKGFTGKQAQRAHMQLAKRRRSWIKLPLPKERGTIGIAEVIAAAPGQERDATIHRWCESVWNAWSSSRQPIVDLVRDELGIE